MAKRAISKIRLYKCCFVATLTRFYSYLYICCVYISPSSSSSYLVGRRAFIFSSFSSSYTLLFLSYIHIERYIYTTHVLHVYTHTSYVTKKIMLHFSFNSFALAVSAYPYIQRGNTKKGKKGTTH